MSGKSQTLARAPTPTDPPCVFCDRAARPDLTERRNVYEDGSFLATHQLSDEAPTTYLGNVLVQTKRHARNLGELTEVEAEALGRLLSRVSRSLMRQTGAEWTYTFSFTEGYRHVHFIVAARYPALPKEYYRLRFAEWPSAPRGTATDVDVLCENLRRDLLPTPPRARSIALHGPRPIGPGPQV